MARVAAANTRRYRTWPIYPLPTAAHKCPICRASLHFDIEYPGSLSSSSEGAQSSFATSSLIQPLALITSADSSLVPQQRTAAARSALSASSIGAENIRSAIGARVLVALAVRQRQPATAVVRSNSSTIREGSLESAVAYPPASPALSRSQPIALPSTHRSSLDSSAAQSSSSATSHTAHRVVDASYSTAIPLRYEVRHQHAMPPSAAERSIALRDAQLHAALDHWFPPMSMIHADVEGHLNSLPGIPLPLPLPLPLPVSSSPSSSRGARGDQHYDPPAHQSSDLQQPLEESSRHVFTRGRQGRKRKRAVVRESNPESDLSTPVRRSRRLLTELAPKVTQKRTH
jgi:hypothetical protein